MGLTSFFPRCPGTSDISARRGQSGGNFLMARPAGIEGKIGIGADGCGPASPVNSGHFFRKRYHQGVAMQFSLTQPLLVGELGFIFILARRCGRLEPERMETRPLYFYLLWLTAYGVITSVLGYRGVYVADELLKTLPGFWLQLVTIAVMVIPIIMFSKVRNAIRQIVDTTPWHWFAYFQGLRIAALGLFTRP